jgi:hypothetical protein
MNINTAVHCLKVSRLRLFVALARALSDQDDNGVAYWWEDNEREKPRKF